MVLSISERPPSHCNRNCSGFPRGFLGVKGKLSCRSHEESSVARREIKEARSHDSLYIMQSVCKQKR